MNAKERVLAAIDFKGPDRIPHMHSYRTATVSKLGKPFLDLLEKYPSDFYVPPHTKDSLEGSDSGVMEDEWGVKWVKVMDGYTGQPKGHPLENWDDFVHFDTPDPDPDSSLSLSHHAGGDEFDLQKKYVCLYAGNLFERLQWLRGMRNVMVDLHTEKAELLELADMIVEYDIRLAENWMDKGADAIVFSDDWGTQQGLMIKPALWRRVFRPRYNRLFSAVRQMGARIHFHSDGYIMDIIPDLIDLGIDVLNPQLNVHDLDELIDLCSGRICIRGGLDRQQILPNGSRFQVRQHVLNTIDNFATHDGGWIACGELGPDVPLANCEEMMASFFRFGKYRP